MTSTLWIIISFLVLISLLFSVSALTYIAYRHVESFETLLTNCKFVQGNRSAYSTAGVFGKTMRLCMIAGMLSTPNFYLRRNLADISDIKNFHQRTKRLILFFWYHLMLSVSSLIIFECVTRYLERG